jgi:hypothetical protein
MKKSFLYTSLGLALVIAGCKREKFAEINTDPDLVYVTNVNVKNLFPTMVLANHTNDFEAYYDINRNIMFWNYHWVRLAGGGASLQAFTTPVTASSSTYRYDNLYSRESMGAGGAGLDMQKIIDQKSEVEKAKFAHIRAIAGIPKAYAAFYLTDVVGSIPYSEAFQARYTEPPVFTPKYDTQEQLYGILDAELKGYVAILKQSLPGQELLGNYDLYYRGAANEAQNWVMAANSLRMKMAMRMYKRKPAAAKAIIDEVLADNVGPINSRAASWVFKAGKEIANGGNWATFGSLSGNKATVDFMSKNGDPRIRNFYRKVGYTQAQFNQLQTAGTIPATEQYREYQGRYVSPDAVSQLDKRHYFNNLPFSPTAMMFSSEIQTALWNRAIGQGIVNFPVITYADVCFMRAELAARNITSENAADWYNKGIDASIRDYNEWGQEANVTGFAAVTAAEIAAYLDMADIKYDPAKGLEQIYVQQYINFYKNPNEAWALIKRTGYPSPTGVVMQRERFTSGGNEVPMPRRWSIALPPLSNLNYANAKAAFDEMQKDPSFGVLNDIRGRVWWDMP